MTQTIVYIVDDDPAVRDSLRWLIESLKYPVKTFESAQEFLDGYVPAPRSCLVLDIRLPGMGGLQLQKKLVDDGIDLPTIIITGHGDVPLAVRALQAGAIHFLEKPFREQEVLDCVQEALDVSDNKHEHRLQEKQVQLRVESLTPREYEVMKAVVSGSTNKQVAEQYTISAKTVEIHRTRVMHKMCAKSLPDLVKMVLMVEPDA